MTQQESEIIEDCIRRVNQMKVAVLQMLVNLPTLQAQAMKEETELQRRQLFAERRNP
jgi:hypothetical protein